MNIDLDRYRSKIELIELLTDNQEKARSARLVLGEILTEISGDLFKKKKVSMLELVDSYPVNILVPDHSVIQSLHLIRIIGANAKHGVTIRDKEATLVVDNLRSFIEYLGAKNNGAKPVYRPNLSEQETRKIYIDTYLREAKWDVLSDKGILVPGKACVEIEVTGMPNGANTGYCDYVLYDDSGRPLAIIEAKKTSVDPGKGRHQADLYAEALRVQYGRKPIIYYTNGYEIYIIDGIYPDRKVIAFHTKEELELLMQKRNRKNIEKMQADETIAGRHYQKMAITALCEKFNDRKRRGLVVMATGTGKTRVAIALTEVLARNGWVKNVLFLADRTALVKQAKRNFASLLPSMTTCELSESSNVDKDLDARIIFSTYQTMIHYIDAEEKTFSSGRFDLVIVDEAHRSIFNRYASIFAYFDSLLVGFTATPRDDVGSSTYSIFECESGEPTYEYQLEEAISDHYLVGYDVINKNTKVMTEGIQITELDREQLAEVNNLFGDDFDDSLSEIPSNMVFKKIFNASTCRMVIEELMVDGLHVDSGETIGKSIIFAYNHRHADMIVTEFRKMYPNMPANTCQLVDYSVNYADDLVTKFDSDPEFRIAVSVDMLDTGVDIPAILNLVFFKPVRSKIKFIQMIGRGTRLCENLFGANKHKTGFRIFDYCDNFEYFQVEHESVSLAESESSISQRLFMIRVELLTCMQNVSTQEDGFLKGYYDTVANTLISQVRMLKSGSSRISVRQNMGYVDKYLSIREWIDLSPSSVVELSKYVSPLISGDGKTDFKVLAFDVRMLRIEKYFLKGENSKLETEAKKIREIVKFLLFKKSAIPQVFEKKNELKELYSERFWQDLSVRRIEELRCSVRDIVKFAVDESDTTIDLDVSDELIDPDFRPDSTVTDIRTYRERVDDYLKENSSQIVIKKIRSLEKLTSEDYDTLKKILWFDLGSEEEYNRDENGKDLAVFIRGIVGISQEAINEKFGQYLSGHQLSSKQQEFLKTLIKYVQQNGDIELKDLMRTGGPFEQIDWTSLFNGNIAPIKDTINKLHDPIVIEAPNVL